MRGKQARRKPQRWWQTILGSVLAVAMVFATIPVGQYVDNHLSAWAAPLTWLALIIGVLASVSYVISSFWSHFWPRLRGWQAGAIIAFTASFCLGECLIHGWQTQLLAAITVLRIVQIVGSVGLVVVTLWWMLRLHRSVSAFTRDIGGAVRTDYLFRDDGERIVVHADKRRLLGQVCIQIIFVAALAAGLRWALAAQINPLVTASIMFLLGLVTVGTALSVVRLALGGPTLVIGPDGLFDHASLTAWGRGLLRWDEIVAVFQYDRKAGFGITYHALGILLTDAEAVQKRQPMWKRSLGFIFGGHRPMMLQISRPLLDRSPDALAQEIRRYVAEHAPKGWHSPLIEDEEGADDEDDEDDEDAGSHLRAR